MTLEPGDLIATGTPPGVGMGMKPAKYLIMRLEFIMVSIAIYLIILTNNIIG